MPGAEVPGAAWQSPPVRISERTGRDPDMTVVLVHGSGHTARVWEPVQVALAHALDRRRPPRARRSRRPTSPTSRSTPRPRAWPPTSTTRVDGPLVLVGHSAGGIVLPALAARLGERVRHLVFVAGLVRQVR